MTDFFHYCDGIGFFFGVLSQFHQGVKKFSDIGQVKVSCNNQVSMHPIVLSQEWMNAFDAVLSKSSITQMTEQ